jgi:hypothetical protein
MIASARPKITPRLRLLDSPHYATLFGARLEGIFEAWRGNGMEITLDVVQSHPLGASKPCVVDGVPAERVRVRETPRRVRFPRAEWRRRTGPFTNLEAVAADDPRRTLFGLRHARHPSAGEIYFLGAEEGELVVRARECSVEDRPGTTVERDVIRRWALTPPDVARVVPAPPRVHAAFAGDPIAIHVRGRLLRRRLFIGGVRHLNSAGTRPAVDAVLNLCEVPDAWVCGGEAHPHDRWALKGEGRAGMPPDDLWSEARWVADRLRADQRVLVHCYAGINRSATVCCAALILLEALSAEAALARVREGHPEAWPDPYHWLLLRWLAAAHLRPRYLLR